MKKISLTLLMLVLTSFNTTKTKEELLFKDEYGKLSIKKDFIVVNFDTEKYLYDIRYVQMLVFLDKKNYLGSVDEKEYNRNKSTILKKYQEEAKKKMPVFDYTNKSLRIEKRNKRCYFFYYEQLIELEFGRKMDDGRYCVGGHNSELQCKEKNIIVTLYYDGIYKYGERIVKNEKDNIKSRVDFGQEHRKSAIFSVYNPTSLQK
jgi:hypothetical protein